MEDIAAVIAISVICLIGGISGAIVIGRMIR